MKRIVAHELRKVMMSPLVLALLVLFLLYNAAMLLTGYGSMREDMAESNRLVSQYGHQIDEEMLTRLRNDYQDGLQWMNRLTKRTEGRTFENISSLYESGTHHVEGLYDESERERFSNLLAMETYLRFISNIDSTYEQLDAMNRAENEIRKYRLSGELAETVRGNYRELAVRIDQLITNGEHKHLFFIGHIFKTHSLLFKTVFRTVLFEVTILTVLLTGHLLSYEFERRTQSLMYSTKRGRSLMFDKTVAALLASLVVTTVLLFGTLAIYFTLFDYTGFWSVPISNALQAEYSWPFISFWEMTFGQYLLASVALVYALALCFFGIASVLSFLFRNSYAVFCGFSVLFGICLLLTGIMPHDSNWLLVAGFTPSLLMMNSDLWWMEGGAFKSYRYIEVITITAWAVLLLASYALVQRRFRKQDI